MTDDRNLPSLVSGRRGLLRQPRAEDAHRGDEHAVPPLEVLLVDGLLPRDERLVARADCREELEDGREGVVEGRVHLQLDQKP